MKPSFAERRGVASVIGTLIFVIVLMAGLGAQAYMSSLQAQSFEISQQAQTVAALRAEELLLYSTPSAGLTTTDSGPTTSRVVAMIMKFENGTVYNLSNPPSGSNPTFVAVTLPPATATLIQSLVPSGVCSSPSGTATCLSKYKSVVSNVVAGRSVGLVTSLGNTFWYVPSASGAPGTLTSRVTSPVTGGSSLASSTLSVSLSANTNYVFEAHVLVTTACSCGGPSMAFAVHALPIGATLATACASYLGWVSNGNPCVTTTGTIMSSGGSYNIAYIFGVVSMGANAGPLRIDMCSYFSGSCTSAYPYTLQPGSFLMASPVT